ncbi:hypothetical protein [Marinimicrobium sp. ARAG 43.8]|uniref:hypothetical protein n=1 Tax=Marinimicrobium sp. ARAG 43.8 TaxID=3418719 RepID=UPI003CFA4CD0
MSTVDAITFFDTRYRVRFPRESVFDLMSDFPRYLTQLPEFHGAVISAEREASKRDSEMAGNRYWISLPDNDYHYKTRLDIIDASRPEQLVYDYQYTALDDEQPLSVAASPMPWNRSRMTLTFEDDSGSTLVQSRMQVFGVSGFLSRWKVSVLKAHCARAQRQANDNLVRVAENLLRQD